MHCRKRPHGNWEHTLMVSRWASRQLMHWEKQLESCSIASPRCRRFTDVVGNAHGWRHAGYSSVGRALRIGNNLQLSNSLKYKVGTNKRTWMAVRSATRRQEAPGDKTQQVATFNKLDGVTNLSYSVGRYKRTWMALRWDTRRQVKHWEIRHGRQQLRCMGHGSRWK